MTAAVAEPVADWTYADRWGMQETIPGLFVGPYAAAKSWDTLALKSISHVLMLRSAEETHLMRPVFPDALRYLTLTVSDSSLENLIPHLPAANAFIQEALSNGGRVLVHCTGGISRAPAFVIGYLMEGLGWDYNRAHTFVQSRRYCISLNEGFKRQLKEYEPIFQARRMPMTGGVVSPGTLKRPMEEDEDDTEGDYSMNMRR